MGSFGLVLMIGSFAVLVHLTIQWAGNNMFTDTRALVLSTSFLVLGLQAMSAALFISIFSGRDQPHGRREQPQLVSVVVVNYNGADALGAVSPRSSNDSSEASSEILVVDNASTDDSAAIAERFAAEHDSVRLLRSPANRGYAGAVNVALAEARGELRRRPQHGRARGDGWLDPLVALLESRPQAGVACPLIVLESDPATDQRSRPDAQQDGSRLQPLARSPARDCGRRALRGRPGCTARRS